MNAITPGSFEIDPVEIDPRPEALLDSDEIIRSEEISEEIERLIYLRACDLVAQWELADDRDRWRHTGEPPPRMVETLRAQVRPYRTPQCTIDAFWYVVELSNPDKLTGWLDDHPQDAAFLLKLLGNK